MNKTCAGCGSIMQSESPSLEGYINEKVYEKATLCERCFKLTHYGEANIINRNSDYKSLIEKINKENKSILYLVSALTLSENTLRPLKEIKTKVYLVLTKIDLLPKSVKAKKLIEKIKEETLIKDIFVISAEKKLGVDEVLNKLEKDKAGEVYVLGYTNAGKSTLINSLLGSVGKKSFITVSSSANTTLELIKIKISENITVIDTPGFINKNSIIEYINHKEYKGIIPKKEIKPKIHILKPEFMIQLGEYLRIENNSKENAKLIFYFKNELPLKKMRSIRNDRLKNLEKTHLIVEEGKDIVVEGLGYIKNCTNSDLDIYVINKNILSIRDKLI